jgi:hypothetical protein
LLKAREAKLKEEEEFSKITNINDESKGEDSSSVLIGPTGSPLDSRMSTPLQDEKLQLEDDRMSLSSLSSGGEIEASGAGKCYLLFKLRKLISMGCIINH